MSDFGFDEEAIYQDADILQAAYEAEAHHAGHLRRRGICLHQGTLGRGNGEGPLPGGFYYEEQETIPVGGVRCTDGCGTTWASHAEHEDAVEEAYGR